MLFLILRAYSLSCARKIQNHTSSLLLSKVSVKFIVPKGMLRGVRATQKMQSNKCVVLPTLHQRGISTLLAADQRQYKHLWTQALSHTRLTSSRSRRAILRCLKALVKNRRMSSLQPLLHETPSRFLVLFPHLPFQVLARKPPTHLQKHSAPLMHFSQALKMSSLLSMTLAPKRSLQFLHGSTMLQPSMNLQDSASMLLPKPSQCLTQAYLMACTLSSPALSLPFRETMLKHLYVKTAVHPQAPSQRRPALSSPAKVQEASLQRRRRLALKLLMKGSFLQELSRNPSLLDPVRMTNVGCSV